MTNEIPATETHVPSLESPSASATASSGLLQATWARWKQIAKAIGVVQTRVLMVIFYFIFVFPLGLLVRRTGDPLHLKAPHGTNWTPHRHEPQSLETARRQF